MVKVNPKTNMSNQAVFRIGCLDRAAFDAPEALVLSKKLFQDAANIPKTPMINF